VNEIRLTSNETGGTTQSDHEGAAILGQNQSETRGQSRLFDRKPVGFFLQASQRRSLLCLPHAPASPPFLDGYPNKEDGNRR